MNEKINTSLLKLCRPISGLKPDKKNARKHDDKNLKAIMDSLEEFGQQKPIIALSTGMVIAGSGTLKAAIKLGWSRLAVVTFDSKQKAKAAAYAIADNRTAELASWDKDQLASTLKDLRPDFDISKLGFDVGELKVFDALTMPTPDKDDEAPAPRKTDIKTGDYFKLGRHRLLCGDSTNEHHIKKLMDGHKADMVFTDPPYNVAYGESKKVKHKKCAIANDKLGVVEWKSFNEAFVKNIVNHYKGGDVYIWGASGPEGMKQRLWLHEAGFHWSATIIWKKQQLVLSPANYQRMYEPAFYGWLKKSTFIGDRKQTEVWEVDRPHDSKLHPTMKPLDLVKRALENSSKPGDSVLDIFGGSGSTLIAAEETQRNCFMCEMVPVYCQVIIDRWEQLTGSKAEKIKAS